MNLYTRALAGYEKSNRVIALAIHPGWVRTDMGTQGAKLSVEESTSAVVGTISRSTLEHTGYYINRFGEQLPF
ncbi:hypothetical protein AAVH_37960 [Aphelenchoides avenae]|nr:hypothetical protein AAVH_37960 [Aphelenchus avenae]